MTDLSQSLIKSKADADRLLKQNIEFRKFLIELNSMGPDEIAPHVLLKVKKLIAESRRVIK